jgi:hypothetical protein
VSDGEGSAIPASTLRIVGGNPTPPEVAAVTAVLTGALDELANERERDAGVRQSAWQRSARAIRTPLTPGYGAWRSF